VLATMMRPLIVIIIGIGLVTIGFFAAHSVASSWVSIRARQGTAQASALYLFFYYMGASIAGSVGGIFWSAYAWMGVATFLIALQVVAFGLTVARLSDKSG
jgi:YNFM family putative membrane transporter